MNPYFQLMKLSWRYTPKDKRKWFRLTYSFFFLVNMITAIYPIILGWFIESIQKSDSDPLGDAWLYVALYIGFTLLEWVFHGPGRLMERKLAFTMSRRFLLEVVGKNLQLPLSWHKEHHSGAVINRIRKASMGLRLFFENGFAYFNNGMRLLISIAAMIYFTPIFGILGLLLGVLSVYLTYVFDVRFVKSLNSYNEAEHQQFASTSDSITNVFTVKTLKLGNLVQSELKKKFDVMVKPYDANTIAGEWKWFLNALFVALIYGVIILGYVYSNYEENEVFYVGGLVTLIGYVGNFTNSYKGIVFMYTQLLQYNTDTCSVNNIHESYDKLVAKNHRGEGKAFDELILTNMGFIYEAKKDPGVENIEEQKGLFALDLTLRKGQKVALVGESGSGKSTLLALLSGLYPMAPGCRVVSDPDPSYAVEDLYESTMLLPQSPEIFENTVLFNLTLGFTYPDHEIQEACEIACLSGFIAELPKGLETEISEGGGNLSGGQIQRLALVRGILAAKRKDVILLDEPTSSVDKVMEKKIYQNLIRYFQDKILICSIHNQQLLPLFDYVYQLEEGRLLKEGKPAVF